MHLKMTDQLFLEQLCLNQPPLQSAKKRYENKEFGKGAREAAAVLFQKPFAHPIQEADIPALAKRIRRDCPDQVKQLRRLSDYMDNPARKVGKSIHADLWVKNAGNTMRNRGADLFVHARLFSITGEQRYKTRIGKCMTRYIERIGALSDDPNPAALAWHPGKNSNFGHDTAHVIEFFTLALPLIRRHLSDTQKVQMAKLFLAISDFNYRALRNDVFCNIPLHFLTACHGAAVCFPLFKDAAKWKTRIRRRLANDYTNGTAGTRDGYYREAFGYQDVNHYLMLKNYLFWKVDTDVPKKVEKLVRASFNFMASLLRNDGKTALIGDCLPINVHEHNINGHELLHLAAVVFNAPQWKAKAGSTKTLQPQELNIWLMGLKGYRSWRQMPTVPIAKRIQKPADFSKSGFQVQGFGKGLDAFQGVLKTACDINHAHSDLGHVDLFALGRPLLTDGGYAGYSHPYHLVDQGKNQHNAATLVRFQPAGPRLESYDWQKTTQVEHGKDLQISTTEHYAYEHHCCRRSLISVRVKGDLGFWIIADRIERTRLKNKGSNSKVDFLESFFHFNAPESELAVEGFSCWSRFNPNRKTFTRYSGGDIRCTGKGQRFNWQEYLEATEDVYSDANLQLTALLPEHPVASASLVKHAGFTSQYSGRVKRPVISLLYRGPLPYSAVYVLVPFRGVLNAAYASVKAKWKKKGRALSLDIRCPDWSRKLTLSQLEKKKLKVV